MNRYSRYTSRQTSLPAFMPSPNVYWPGGSLENWNALAQKDFQKNPWNYSQDYLYGGQGPDLTEQYMNSKNWLGISKKDNPFSKGNLGIGSKDNNSNSGGGKPSAYGFLSAIPETEINAAGRTMKRGLWDMLDPLYFLGSDKHHNAVGEGFSDAGVQMFKSSAQSGNAWGMLAGGVTKAIGSLINAGWGGVDEEQKAKNDQAKAYYGSYKSNARTYDDLTPILDQEDYKDSYYGGWFRPGWAERHNREDRFYYNNSKEGAYTRRSNNIKSIGFENDMMARRNAIAFGGPLDTMNNDNMGAIGYNFMSDYLTMKNNQNSKNNNNTQIPTFFSEGGSIEIKHPGRLTELKKRTGKTEAELWAEGKPDVRKMITFARNSRKFKHALGGYLDAKDKLLAFGGNLGTNSTDWSTGLIHVDEGKSHELNPLGGVPMGIDKQGNPNLVEENEVIYDDYVFSARISVDDETKQKFHIGKKKEITYADLAKKLEKEILERPNDPISKSGFKAQMQTLEENQERQKQEMEAERARQAFEALPPEEQVAMMNRANQEEQMAQQAIQEQAMNQPSPEEVAVAQEQMIPEAEAAAAPQMQAMGGKLYADGGDIDKKWYSSLTPNNKWIVDTLGLRNAEELDSIPTEVKLAIRDIRSGRDTSELSEERQQAIREVQDIMNTLGYGELGLSDLKSEDLLSVINSYRTNHNLPTPQEATTLEPEYRDGVSTVLGEVDIRPEVRPQSNAVLPEEGLQDYTNRGGVLTNIPGDTVVDDKAFVVPESSIAESTVPSNIEPPQLSPETVDIPEEILQDIPLSRERQAVNPAAMQEGLRKAFEEREALAARDISDDEKRVIGEVLTTQNPTNPTYKKAQQYYAQSNTTEPAATDEKGDEKDIPEPKDHWLRYAGLLGPATGLAMMAAGVGKPKYDRIDAALANLNNPTHATWKPIGDYLTYNPMDIWYEQNRLNANARSTDRAIMNNSMPIGTKMAGLLANGYNNQIASGNLYRQALEYNDNQKARVTDFNRGTNMYNAKAFTDNSQFNATADNAFAQARAKLGLAAAEQILDSEAGWYNSLYKNINNGFKGMSDLGRDKTEKAWLKWLADKGYFGNLGNKTAEGGKIKKKRKSGLTY